MTKDIGWEEIIHHTVELGGTLKVFLPNPFNSLDEETKFKKEWLVLIH